MGMQLRYGSYYFPVNGVNIEVTELEHIRSDANIVFKYRTSFRCMGYLLLSNSALTGAAAQQDLSTQSALLDIALKIPYQDLTLLQDDGTPSYTNLQNATSYSGVVITNGPTFQSINGNDYASQRQFRFAGFVEYAASAVNIVTSFRESLTFSGGMPIRIAKRALNGPPQIQVPYLQTEFTVVQAGQAEALRGYPIAPPPLFPAALAEAPVLRSTSPVRNAGAYERWGITWEYRFLSASPLVGLPNLWTTA